MIFFVSLNLDVEVEEEGEESKWQDRISSGFDRLVAFASTELDKRRRSTEGNESCNTSPDSGIGHGSNDLNLSTSITTAAPPSTKQILKLNPNIKPTLFKMPNSKSYLVDTSPIISEQTTNVEECGLPRTPSPSSSPINYSPEGKHVTTNQLNPALLKYQRYPEEKKSKPDTHFKKKFYYREQWRDESMWQQKSEHSNRNNDTTRDKFKPKGKGWDWNKEQHNQIVNDDWGRSHHDHYMWKN